MSNPNVDVEVHFRQIDCLEVFTCKRQDPVGQSYYELRFGRAGIQSQISSPVRFFVTPDQLRSMRNQLSETIRRDNPDTPEQAEFRDAAQRFFENPTSDTFALMVQSGTRLMQAERLRAAVADEDAVYEANCGGVTDPRD